MGQHNRRPITRWISAQVGDCFRRWFWLVAGCPCARYSLHTATDTPVNVNDVTQGHGLLHGEEALVFADAGYQGADKRAEATGVQWHIALRPGKRRALDN